jgi:hypothetical protein
MALINPKVTLALTLDVEVLAMLMAKHDDVTFEVQLEPGCDEPEEKPAASNVQAINSKL